MTRLVDDELVFKSIEDGSKTITEIMKNLQISEEHRGAVRSCIIRLASCGRILLKGKRPIKLEINYNDQVPIGDLLKKNKKENTPTSTQNEEYNKSISSMEANEIMQKYHQLVEERFNFDRRGKKNRLIIEIDEDGRKTTLVFN